MKEQLERLIQQVQETHLVERLVDAKSLQERVKICEEAKATAEFVAFKQCYDAESSKVDVEEESVIPDGEFDCTSDNAVAIAVILLIENIDDVDMFNDYDMLIDALREADDEQEGLAESIANFLEANLITSHTLEEVLEEFF